MAKKTEYFSFSDLRHERREQEAFAASTQQDEAKEQLVKDLSDDLIYNLGRKQMVVITLLNKGFVPGYIKALGGEKKIIYRLSEDQNRVFVTRYKKKAA